MSPRAALLCLACGFLLGGESSLSAQFTPDHMNPLSVPTPTPGKLLSAKDFWRQKRNSLREGTRSNKSPVATPTPTASKKITAPVPTPLQNRPSVTSPPYLAVPTIGAKLAAEASEQSTGPADTTTAPAVPTRPIGPTISYGDFERSSLQRLLRRLDGSRYGEGATPEDGFSPEGLVHYVFSRLGHRPPLSDAKTLLRDFGLAVPSAQTKFQPGDILFFSLYSKSKDETKLFVGICLNEEEMVYPSFTRSRVVTRRYNTQFWRERFVGARRIFFQ